MGTTQRIIPGITGEPNWGDLNKSITYIAKTVEAENANNDKADSEQQTSKQEKLLNRRNNYVKAAYKSLMKTGGGARSISTGKSKSIGRAGNKSARKLAGFFSVVGSSGLQKALNQIGFGDLKDKSVGDIIDFLLIYCNESNAGMDETAASKASCEILNKIAEESGNDLEKFESIIGSYLDTNMIHNIICEFWGFYIFEHLSQRFQEKLTQQKGTLISKETFRIIKEDIVGQVKLLNDIREISKIDWHSLDGNREIEIIFESTTKILLNEN
jgi:hypothetical protein